MRLSDLGPPEPPLHNLLLPHGPYMDERGCPPACPYRIWTETYISPPVSTPPDTDPDKITDTEE